MLHIVLSGPQSQAKSAQKALQDAGFTIVLNELGDPLAHDWGMAPNHETEVVDGVVTPKESKVPTAFITVEGDDVVRAAEFVEPLRWRLRSHFDKPEVPPKPTPAEMLRRLGLKPADLRAFLAEQ